MDGRRVHKETEKAPPSRSRPPFFAVSSVCGRGAVHADGTRSGGGASADAVESYRALIKYLFGNFRSLKKCKAKFFQAM